MEAEMKARAFAHAAHAAVKQTRKISGEPYIVHPEMVVNILKEYSMSTPSVYEIQAAWLHDTIEDTGVTAEDIRALFGEKVEELVLWVTKTDFSPLKLSRSVRKQIECAKLKDAPYEAKNIKLADIIANLSDIEGLEKDFAKLYLSEKELDLENALWNGDVGLVEKLVYTIKVAEKTLDKKTP